jgi:hypothetical protein
MIVQARVRFPARIGVARGLVSATGESTERTEPLVAGAAVIVFAQRAAAEVVFDGENGHLVSDELEMPRAIGQVGAFDPARCRASVAAGYGVVVATTGYEGSTAVGPSSRAPW